QVEVERHDLFGQRAGGRILARVGLGAHGGAGCTRVDAVGAHVGDAVQLVGHHLHQAFGGELGNCVGAPVGAALAADAAGGEGHGGVLRQLEQRQKGAAEHEHGVDVDVHHAHEVVAGEL